MTKKENETKQKKNFYWTDINQKKPMGTNPYLLVSNGRLTDTAYWITKMKKFEDSLSFGLTHEDILFWAKLPEIGK